MSLDHTAVEKIAHLARMNLDESEVDRYAHDLSKILDLVGQMNQADTGDAEPMAHPLHMCQRLRPDELTQDNERELFQAVAPLTEGGLYLVPKVIE